MVLQAFRPLNEESLNQLLEMGYRYFEFGEILHRQLFNAEPPGGALVYREVIPSKTWNSPNAYLIGTEPVKHYLSSDLASWQVDSKYF